MQRSNIDNKDKVIVFAAILCDIIIINAIFFLMVNLKNQNFMISHRLILLNICYILSIPFGGIMLARRRVRAYQVVATALKGTIYFVVIWCLVISFSKYIIFSAQYYISYFLVVSIIMIIGRVVVHLAINRFRNSGRNLCHVIFVGSSSSMINLYDEMSPKNNVGYNIYGYFDDQPSRGYPAECRYLGSVDMVEEFTQSHDLHRIYCGLETNQKSLIKKLIIFCERNLIRFYNVPDLGGYMSRSLSLELLSDVPVFSILEEPLQRIENRVIKRTFDIVFSVTFLITAFPIICLIFGTLIKLSSPGPIFFRQKRHGINGREFWCYKFRSMRLNQDADNLQATEDDPRKTRVGDFMRRTNIDELPQFLNVLLGNMSVVGPRPHMLKHTELYSNLIDEYMVRHLIKPGVTGWAQINGYRGETKTLDQMKGRVKADIWYMEHWNFILDIYIIYKTIVTTFIHDKRAY